MNAKRCVAVLLCCALLSGCESTQILKGRGEATMPPLGYIVECVKHPELENCKP